MAVTFGDLGKMGRLGNQLFQIASTIGIGKEYNIDYTFNEWIYQKYFKRNLPNNPLKLSPIVLNEKSFTYEKHVLEYERDNYLRGYFQTPKYWEAHEADVLQYFEFNKKEFPLYLQLMAGNVMNGNVDAVAMHVRRGDYLNIPDYHTNLGLDYYSKALEHFPNKQVCIFSDDIEWCAKTFTDERFFFSHEEKDINDLFLMSHFKNIIIANSTFSWWAAYLPNNKNKKVIAPKQWFGKVLNHSTEDLIPKNWIQL